MSATSNLSAEAGALAHVNFRVRCEALGHGEAVYLVEEGDAKMQKLIPLYTTATAYPWYSTIQALTIALPRNEQDLKNPNSHYFRYRYAIHRGGKFYRFEKESDAPSMKDDDGDSDTPMDSDAPTDMETEEDKGDGEIIVYHQVPLRLLHNRESYVVNDVLGKTTGPPDIDHNRMEPIHGHTSASVASMHSKNSSFGGGSFVSNKGSAAQLKPASSARKKAVGFAPPPPPYHRPKAAAALQAVHLNSTDGLVVVSAFLPVILHRSDMGKWTADWDYEALLSMQTHLRVTRIGVVKWRGWHGNFGLTDKTHASPEAAGVPVNERHLVEECLRPFHCVPVWMDTMLFGEMYNGFCKTVLWPVLHNVTSVYSTQKDLHSKNADGEDLKKRDAEQFSEVSMDDVERGGIHGGHGRERELWSAYNTVNRKFAEVVVQNFNEGDLVWIHGFHLLILPSYLTRRIPMAKVGIFLHTPFPSSEIFRTLWCREDLLRGMLNADQVGFHLFEYARHFLTCCRRLLGLNYGMIPDASGGHTLAIDTHGRHVAVTSIHAGIEPHVLNQVVDHMSTKSEAATIRNRFSGKTVFLAIDRLESLKGIPLKLLALENFLKNYPQYVGKIVLVQVGISAFERGSDYEATKNEVETLVRKINTTWPGSVQFQECTESNMRLQQRMVLMRAADVVVVTPIRDGLNLMPLEFTVAHYDALTPAGMAEKRMRGLCVLSEFASCTRVMRGALHVNPWKVSEIAASFHQALTMSEDEWTRRVQCSIEFVSRVTTQRWALAVLMDLKGVHKTVNPIQYSGAGLGLGYRIVGMEVGFQSLDFSKVAKAFKNARSRLILLDYGGTITHNDNLDNLSRFKMVKERKAHSKPSAQMINTIKDLCADKKNTVFVVSGKERHSLTKILGDIPRLGLAAEHGMYISWPTNQTAIRRQWETLVPITDTSWRPLATAVMEVYTSRTHGSYIEETEMKVLWQYRDADLEFGYVQARELEDHLANVLRGYPVDILHGGVEEGGYVEVRPKGVNKGMLAMKAIKNFPSFSQIKKVEFALVLGDDHCDEPMLSVMRQIGRRVTDARRLKNGDDPLPDLPASLTLVDVSSCDDYLAPNLEMFTCTVGKKPSAAANYLRDVNEVQELLDALNKTESREQRFFSAVNLQDFSKDNNMAAQHAFDRFDNTLASNTMKRPASLGSMGGLHASGSNPAIADQKVSANLGEYLGGFDDAAEEDDIFF